MPDPFSSFSALSGGKDWVLINSMMDTVYPAAYLQLNTPALPGLYITKAIVHGVQDPTLVTASILRVRLDTNEDNPLFTTKANGSSEETAGARNAGNKVSSCLCSYIFTLDPTTAAGLNIEAWGARLITVNFSGILTPWPFAPKPCVGLFVFRKPWV